LSAQVFLDGVDKTGCVQTGSVTRTLNRPAQATARLYSECATGNACSHMKVLFNGTLWFHGFVTQISTEAGEDGTLISEYTALDPMMLWQYRPARDPDGDFSNPSFIMDFTYGPQILEAILNASETGGGGPPADAEGPLFIDLAGATYDTGVADLSGAPTDWPMTIAEVFELLASTGELDAVLTPIDAGGNMASLVVKNGNYGTDRTATVAFEYETGDHNVRAVRMTEDSTNVCNKLWYYLGPRVLTATDPAGDQHWRANITGQRPEFDPNGTAELVPPGGRAVDATNAADPGPPWTNDQLGERIYDSRTGGCGVRMEVRIYDAQGDENPAALKWLYMRQWQVESWLRAIPRTLVHITPVRTSQYELLPPGVTPVQVGDFDIGDLVTVTAGSIVRGGFTGAQRVYAYTVTFDEDGILELGELQTSSDQEGLGP
jgi:hypothetical protein